MKHSVSDKGIAPTGGRDECLIGCSLSSLLIHMNISHPSLVWKPAEAMRPYFLSLHWVPGTYLAMQTPPYILPRYSACSSKTNLLHHELLLPYFILRRIWDSFLRPNNLSAPCITMVGLMLGAHRFSLWSSFRFTQELFNLFFSMTMHAHGSKSRFFYSLVTRR